MYVCLSLWLFIFRLTYLVLEVISPSWTGVFWKWVWHLQRAPCAQLLQKTDSSYCEFSQATNFPFGSLFFFLILETITQCGCYHPRTQWSLLVHQQCYLGGFPYVVNIQVNLEELSLVEFPHSLPTFA